MGGSEGAGRVSGKLGGRQNELGGGSPEGPSGATAQKGLHGEDPANLRDFQSVGASWGTGTDTTK